MVQATVDRGGTLFFCGNGGSAADAQHLATEYVVRYQRERRAIAAIALTTDTSLITAAANDYAFEQIFARQIEALGKPGDLLVMHTTSGKSANLLRAAEVAKQKGVATLALSLLRGRADRGDGGPLHRGPDRSYRPRAGDPVGDPACDLRRGRREGRRLMRRCWWPPAHALCASRGLVQG